MDESYGAKPAAPVAPPESGGEPAETKPAAEKESVDEENAGAAEILVAKNKLPDVKEGDTCTFKVVKDFGDEWSLEYVKEPAAGAGAEPGEDTMSSVGADFAAMDEKG